jgi:hypothetical protein
MATETNAALNVSQLSADEIDWSEIDVDGLSEEELDVLERKIAGRYMHIVPWGAIA